MLSCTKVPVYLDAIRVPSKGLAVVGDTQRTMHIEATLGRETNDDERKRIANQIAAFNPDALLIIGDLVADGSSSHDWNKFDELMSPVRDAGIPVLALMGNHDYFGIDRAALKNSSERFPQLGTSRWYSREYGDIALVFVDSNDVKVGTSEWEKQAEWFRATLANYQSNPSIAAILCFSHHPPYTNSTVSPDETHVQSAFFGSFNAASKAKAWIAGHVHSYEHFLKDGKTFIVSGGGGGPRVKLRTGPEARHADLFSGDSPRAFHFLHLERITGFVRVKVHGMDKGGQEFRVIDSFEIAI